MHQELKIKNKHFMFFVIVFIVAFIGTLIITTSHASTPNTSLYASDGNVAGNAQITHCNGASSPSGNCVMFGGSNINKTLLHWAPPILSSPTTIDLSSCNTTLNKVNLSTTTDYTIKIPSEGCGPLWIDGGHNVVIIGGHVYIPSTANHSDNGADHTSNGIYIEGATGTVHIEGVLINAATNVMFDAIDVNAPSAIVQVENVRAENVWGTNNGATGWNMHADMIQTWGGDAALRVDHFTGNGDYQGFQINPDQGPTGPATIMNADLTTDSPPSALASVTKGGGILIWTTGANCSATPITLSNVYFINNRGMSPGGMGYPTTTSGTACDATLSNNQLSWPKTSPAVVGYATIGAPTAGSFVPSGVAGSNYVSPGYQ